MRDDPTVKEGKIIDMVNDKEDREGVTLIMNLMSNSIPPGVPAAYVATACFLILCQIASCTNFSDQVISELEENLKTSLEQAKMQHQSMVKITDNISKH